MIKGSKSSPLKKKADWPLSLKKSQFGKKRVVLRGEKKTWSTRPTLWRSRPTFERHNLSQKKKKLPAGGHKEEEGAAKKKG